ncbi:MAG TPA: hypothetical protein VGQ09_22970 [Chitinophagaceae bacterium]|jgi:uridine kinase|nr:hypothetical protein [Chitinophagaceae bacterium]
MPDEFNKRTLQTIIQNFYAHSADHVFTVAISGIDASGKSYVTKLLEDELRTHGLKIANINLDPWQNPIPVRLQKVNAAENFYKNVFRWNDIFSKLIIPLRKTGNIQHNERLIRTHADEYYDFRFDYNEIDVLLIEAIFLFQEKYLGYYDFKIWIDCSFETGLKRAIQRNVEKLDAEQLMRDYNTYYYPAQRYHFEKDNPRTFADVIHCNDELIGTVGQLTVKF